MAENLPWFKHAKDARNAPGAKALLAQYGFEGYGRLDILKEIIAEQPGARLDVRVKMIRSGYAKELGLKPDEFDAFLAFLANPEECGLIHNQDGIITTPETDEAFLVVDEKRAKARKSSVGQPSDDRNVKTDVQNKDSGVRFETEQSRAEQIRLEQQQREGLSVDNLAEETKKLGLMLPRQDLGSLQTRMSMLDLGLDFIAFCGKRVAERRGIKNPRALLKRTLFEYTDAAAEYLVKKRPDTRLASDPGPCPACGESLKSDRRSGEARCTGCGIWLHFDFAETKWIEGVPA